MSKTLNSLFDWSGGELSPKYDARVDSPVYRKGARQMLNVLPYKQGGFTRRPGSQMIAPAKYASPLGYNYAVRMESFIFSPDTTFELEFGNHYVRFYSNGQQVTINPASLPFWISTTAYTPGQYVQSFGVGYVNILAVPFRIPPLSNTAPANDPTHWQAGAILELPTPYNADAGSFGPQPGNIYDTDIWQLAFEQINDIIYITHPDYPPYSLTRFSDVDWVMVQVPFLTPALLDQNATDTAIAASATKGNGITLTASAPNWTTATYYTVGDSVTNGGIIYNCVTPNVSAAAFSTDLSAGYWTVETLFNSGHIGSTWQLSYLNNASYLEVDGTASAGFTNGVSGTIEVIGGWEVHTYGVWSSDIAVQQSLDQGSTWTTVQVITSRSDANYDITGTAEVLSLYRFNITNSAALVGPTVVAGSFISGTTYTIATIGSTDFTLIGAASNTVGLNFVATGVGAGTGTATIATTGATNPRVVFSIDNAFIDGLAFITAVTDAYHATANVVTQLLNTAATTFWSEAAWSDYRGFPAAVTSYQQRIIYGGSGFEPQRIWGTVTDDIQNFALGDQSQATDSFAFDLNAPSRGPIQWLIAQLDLFVGFAGAEWVVNSGSTNSTGQSSGAAITPTSVNAVESSSWGSAPNVAPAIIGDVLMFTQRQATSLRQMLFSVYSEKYMTTDLTELADHLFSSGIAQIAYQTRWHKQSLIWVVTQIGTLCAMTYELDKGITGWCRCNTGFGQFTPSGAAIPPDNGFESVSVIPGEGLNDDQVWVVANRKIGGVATRFIERLNPQNWEEQLETNFRIVAPNPTLAYYVDCGMTIFNPPTLTLTGLDYLDGRYVVGLADSYAFGPLLVTGGSVTLSAAFPVPIVVQIGLPIMYAGQPMRLDADPIAGNVQGKHKSLDSRCYVRVWNAMGGSISNGTTPPPLWQANFGYEAGDIVISPISQLAYQCVISAGSNVDPFQNPNGWAQIGMPVSMPPVPIDYTPDTGNPFATPVFVSTPTDKLVAPQLMPVDDNDPILIIQGNDALPLTVLALILKPDIGKD